MTLATALLSKKLGRPTHPGEFVVAPVDGTMATDATGPFAIEAFQRMGATRVWDADRISLILDHAAPAPNERVANLHRMLREFAAAQGIRLYDVGEGICHQLMVENGHVGPGDIFAGADSHTTTYGAVSAFAMGVGSTDLAAVWKTGEMWLKVPTSLQVILSGQLQPRVTAKDVILSLIGQLGIAGATYEAVEYAGPALADMTLASRMVLCNMVAELGAKTALMPSPDAGEIPAARDDDYTQSPKLNLDSLEPQIAKPHSPENVVPLTAVQGTPVQAGFIGSCTNGRLEDLQAAADILTGEKLAAGSRLIIAPASRAVFQAALADGTVEVLSAAGATFIPAGCGPCVGTHQGIPGDDENVISSTNRNFPGRMGNPRARVFLGSPASVAMAVLTGEISDPREHPQAAANE